MKKKKGGGGGGANWMDTYGDMVTLLLCFFVLLYSMSTISEDNWRALVMSFNPDAAMAFHETPGGSGPNADYDEGEGGPISSMASMQAEVDDTIEQLFQALQEYVAATSQQSSISVVKEGGKIFISFSDTVFFDPNSAVLLEESKPILDDMCVMLTDAEEALDEVRVLGHTAQYDPDRPNDVYTDRSLSSLRAATVIAYVQEHSGVDPARLISEGWGQWRPIGDNDTVEGRAQNRRVEMIISGRNLEEELGDGIEQYSTSGEPGDSEAGDASGGEDGNAGAPPQGGDEPPAPEISPTSTVVPEQQEGG